MAIRLYGIPNCDQVRQARAWLDAHGKSYAFHDFKKSGIERNTIEAWLRELDWETLLNRKGSTWRTLDEKRRTAIADASNAIALMLEYPTLIKRPVLANGKQIHAGFSDELYTRLFGK
jgi:arsenate reductase (glutaredoxin)